MSHPLDKAIWNALATRQAHFAHGDSNARAYESDVSPFAAARDNVDPGAIAALAALTPTDGDISLLEPNPPAAPPNISATTRDGVQMLSTRAPPAAAQSFAIEALSAADAPDMLALATLTRPGPFRARTHLMGRFLGIRDGARLVAMGGERITLEGFTELSGLCTHPDYRGRGYGEALMRAIVDRLGSEGVATFLHAYADNHGAIALYRRMGFEIRTQVVHAIWRRAARSG